MTARARHLSRRSTLVIVCCARAGDALDGTEAHPDTGNAAFNMFLQNCGSRIGAALIWIVLVNIFFAGVAMVTSRAHA